jgi:hypothetical protein
VFNINVLYASTIFYDFSATVSWSYNFDYDLFLPGTNTSDRSVTSSTFSPDPISFALRDDPCMIINNKFLPTSLDLMNFSSGSFVCPDTAGSIKNPGYGLVRELSDSIEKLILRQSAPFPEPTTVVLLAAGLIGLASRGKIR